MDVLLKIEKLRKEKNWTVYRLANEAGITQSTLSNMFTRGTLPSITTLENICLAFGITMEEFFRENNKDQLTPDERILIENYKKLPEKEKLAVKNLISTLTIN